MMGNDQDVRLNVLVAYPYLDDRVKRVLGQNAKDIRLLVDSGAFTAFKQGTPISLDSYCRFIESLPVQPWRYFSLDVIGNPAETLKNYETMLARGFTPVPVLTRGESLSVLDDFYKTSDCVGLGGVSGKGKSSYEWVRAVMQHVGNRKAHILGFTSLNWVKFLKPYSCDSSAISSVSRYGSFDLYMGSGRVKKVNKSDFLESMTDEVKKRIARHGVDYRVMGRQDEWRGVLKSMVPRIAVGSWIDLSLDAQRNLGTLLFLAVTTDVWLSVLIERYYTLRHLYGH